MWRRRVLVVAALWFGSNWLGCAARPSSPPARAPEAAKQNVEEYELSKGTKRLLQTLGRPMLIDAYVTKGSGPAADSFADELLTLLAAYERAGRGTLTVRVTDVRTAESREQAEQAGVQQQALQQESSRNVSDQAVGYFGLSFEYGDQKMVIPRLPVAEADGLEFWVTTKIHEIRDKADHIVRRIGLLSGKGELGLKDTNLVPSNREGEGPSILSILNQAFPFYGFEPIDLLGGSRVVDPGLEGVIVTQARQDYTEGELRRLDEFLMLGGKALVVYSSAVGLEPFDPTLQANLSTHGLDALLDRYGIHMNCDAVFDHGEQFRVRVMTQNEEEVYIRHPAIPRLTYHAPTTGEEQSLDASFAGFFRMDELIMPFASSLELRRSEQPADVELRAVAHSSSQSSVEACGPIDLRLRAQWSPHPPFKQRMVAAYALGNLQSAFQAAHTGTRLRAPRSSRVLVVSSSLFLTNPFAYAGNPQPGSARRGDPKLLMFAQPYTKYLTSTILSVKNTLDWMIGDEELIAASAKLVRPRHSHRGQ